MAWMRKLTRRRAQNAVVFPIVGSTLSGSKREESDTPGITKQDETPFEGDTFNKMKCARAKRLQYPAECLDLSSLVIRDFYRIRAI